MIDFREKRMTQDELEEVEARKIMIRVFTDSFPAPSRWERVGLWLTVWLLCGMFVLSCVLWVLGL